MLITCKNRVVYKETRDQTNVHWIRLCQQGKVGSLIVCDISALILGVSYIRSFFQKFSNLSHYKYKIEM